MSIQDLPQLSPVSSASQAPLSAGARIWRRLNSQSVRGASGGPARIYRRYNLDIYRLGLEDRYWNFPQDINWVDSQDIPYNTIQWESKNTRKKSSCAGFRRRPWCNSTTRQNHTLQQTREQTNSGPISHCYKKKKIIGKQASTKTALSDFAQSNNLPIQIEKLAFCSQMHHASFLFYTFWTVETKLDLLTFQLLCVFAIWHCFFPPGWRESGGTFTILCTGIC